MWTFPQPVTKQVTKITLSILGTLNYCNLLFLNKNNIELSIIEEQGKVELMWIVYGAVSIIFRSYERFVEGLSFLGTPCMLEMI